MADTGIRKCVICGKWFHRRSKRHEVALCSEPCRKERVKQKIRLRKAADPEEWAKKRRFYTACFRAGQAMPPWVNLDEIKRIYSQCPKGKVVDHIIGLAKPEINHTYFEGRPVCGLHVPWNLQYVTQSANVLKSARIKKPISYNGITDTIAGWARRTGISYSRLAQRIDKLGWPIERALTAPRGNQGKRTTTI